MSAVSRPAASASAPNRASPGGADPIAPNPISRPAARASRVGRYSWPMATVTENEDCSTRPLRVRHTSAGTTGSVATPKISGAPMGIVHISMRLPPMASAVRAPQIVPTAPANDRANTASPAC
ncbi:MAG: hypothetical protein R2878_02290 [Thermoleophilia bacterium]